MNGRFLLKIFPAVLLIVAMLTGVSPSFLTAKAKKRPIDKLKYPALNKFQLAKVEKEKMANGIKLRLIKDDKLPLVNIIIMFRGGDAYDGKSKVGLAGITARLMRIGGVKGIKPDELDKQLDINGITIGVNSSLDRFTVSLNCLIDNLDQGLELMAKIVKEPAFADEKLEEIKTQNASGISRRNDNPQGIQYREFDKLIYGADSPFAAVLEHEHLNNISKADITRTYSDFFAANNMLVGVVGPLNMDRVKQLFEKNFGSWSTKSKMRPFPVAKEQSHDFKIAFAVKDNLNQNYISVGHMGLKRKLANEPRFLVFNSIFSQGSSSRLYHRIRTKMGLSYGANGGILTNRLYPGTIQFNTFTKSESTVPVLKAIFEEMDIIRKEKVTQAELNDAKDYFLNSFVFQYSTPSNILSRSLLKELYRIQEDYDEKLLEGIRNVTADDILEVAQKFLSPEKMMVCLVGNEKKIEGNLSDIGKVQKIDLTIKPPKLKEKIPPATPESLAKGKKVIDALIAGKYKGYIGLKSLISDGNTSLTMQGRSFQMQQKTTTLYPDKIRMDISVMGMNMYTVMNGDKGIQKQMGPARPIPADQVEKNRFGDLYDVFNHPEKYNIQYLKEDKIDGKSYDVLYLTDSAKKNWKKFFVNKESGLIEMEESLSVLPGQSGVQRSVKSDFKVVNGITFAFKSTISVKDKKIMEATLKDIKVNPKVDASLFNIETKK